MPKRKRSVLRKDGSGFDVVDGKKTNPKTIDVEWRMQTEVTFLIWFRIVSLAIHRNTIFCLLDVNTCYSHKRLLRGMNMNNPKEHSDYDVPINTRHVCVFKDEIFLTMHTGLRVETSVHDPPGFSSCSHCLKPKRSWTWEVERNEAKSLGLWSIGIGDIEGVSNLCIFPDGNAIQCLYTTPRAYGNYTYACVGMDTVTGEVTKHDFAEFYGEGDRVGYNHAMILTPSNDDRLCSLMGYADDYPVQEFPNTHRVWVHEFDDLKMPHGRDYCDFSRRDMHVNKDKTVRSSCRCYAPSSSPSSLTLRTKPDYFPVFALSRNTLVRAKDNQIFVLTARYPRANAFFAGLHQRCGNRSFLLKLSKRCSIFDHQVLKSILILGCCLFPK